ncbi:CBS domain-containing protein, partial [Acinetobacter baumannii]
TPVAEVARVMAEKRIGSAIVTKNNKLVGIFTVTDACRALAQILGDRDERIEDIVA